MLLGSPGDEQGYEKEGHHTGIEFKRLIVEGSSQIYVQGYVKEECLI